MPKYKYQYAFAVQAAFRDQTSQKLEHFFKKVTISYSLLYPGSLISCID